MIRDEAVGVIQRMVGDRADKFDDIVSALVHSQEQLENHGLFRPWFLQTERSTGSTTVGEERVVLPSDFIAEFEQDALFLFDGDLQYNLTKRPLDVIRTTWPRAERGRPRAYSVDALYIRLGPIPDKVYSLRMSYFGRDVSLTTNIENLWLRHASDWLIGHAGKKIATEVSHAVAIRAFSEMEQRGMRTCYIDSEAREHSNQTYLLGT